MSISRRGLAAQFFAAGASSVLLVRAAAAQSITQYSYDLFGRLTRATHPSGYAVTYTYDDAGNRTAVAVAPAWPTFGSAGSVVAPGTPSSVSVPYPSGIAAGDQLIIVSSCYGDDVSFGGPAPAVSTPSGWTRVDNNTAMSSVPIYGTVPWWPYYYSYTAFLRAAIFIKAASGSETGSQNLSWSNAGTSWGQMLRFRGGSGANHEGYGHTIAGTNDPLNGDGVSTSGDNRLAVMLLTSYNGPSSTPAATGMSGGTWVQPDPSGAMGLCTAGMPSAGTITGGSYSGIDGASYPFNIVQSFAIY